MWLPSDHDISLVREWLVTSSLTSPQHLIAKVIISGLNWGIKDTEVREGERGGGGGEGGREKEREIEGDY